MQIIVYTHVHLYNCYSLERAFERALCNLSRYSREDSIKCLLLTERADCDFFSGLSNGEKIPSGFSVEGTEEAGAFRIVRSLDAKYIYIFAGQQIVTKERIEVLAVLCSSQIEDGLDLKSTILQVLKSEGLPVLCWAPGKWSGKRGRLVIDIVKDKDISPLYLGDSTHRIKGLSEPDVFVEGRASGRNILAGSDPLPLIGEEVMTGSYGSLFDGKFDSTHPVTSLRSIISGSHFPATFGKRCGVFSGLWRLGRNELRRRLGL